MKQLQIDNLSNQEEILLLDTCFSELNYLKKRLILLNKYKPFFFELNKLKRFNREKIEIEQKIGLCEKKISYIINDEMPN